MQGLESAHVKIVCQPREAENRLSAIGPTNLDIHVEPKIKKRTSLFAGFAFSHSRKGIISHSYLPVTKYLTPSIFPQTDRSQRLNLSVQGIVSEGGMGCWQQR